MSALRRCPRPAARLWLICCALTMCVGASGPGAAQPTSATAGVEFSGVVQPFREVVLSSPVQSFITELHVREGSVVEKDALLAQLYVREEALLLDRAEAALRKREFENRGAQSLFSERLISADEALAREIELQLALIQTELAREAIRLRQIRTPISGIVVERRHEAGEMVTVGQPLFTVIDIDSVFVRIFCTVDEARAFVLGDALSLHFPELGEAGPTLAGVVEFIDPRVDPASGLLQVKVLAENPMRAIKPGLRSTVRVAPPAREVQP